MISRESAAKGTNRPFLFQNYKKAIRHELPRSKLRGIETLLSAFK